MEKKRNEIQGFSAPETKEETPTVKKTFGLTKKQWAGVGISVCTFITGAILGHKVGKKSGLKQGYACGRAVGAVINNCSESEASNVLGTDVNMLKTQDQEYLGVLKAQGKIK